MDMYRHILIVCFIMLTIASHLGAPSSYADDEPKTAKAEREFAEKFITSAGKGYTARPCGFDMNRNGIVGEFVDRKVADGRTRDPDGDGVEEDILYVDSVIGNDQTGDGSTSCTSDRGKRDNHQ